jgi:hypothetical protein
MTIQVSGSEINAFGRIQLPRRGVEVCGGIAKRPTDSVSRDDFSCD